LSLKIAKRELKASLSQWSLKHNVLHAALNDLLVILKPHVIDSNIPNCAKTLLRIPARVELQYIAGGQFFYFGVLDQIITETERGLVACKFPIVQKLESKYPNKEFLTLSVSTDGIPICQSSNVQMWPILFKVDQNSSCRPLLAGIFCGENKPFCVKEFLNPFVHELKILEDGIMIMDRLFYVRISCIVADAPARSFVKGTKGHTAYHGCERCEDEGSWAGRMTYSCKPHILRTDDRFKHQIDSDHHVNVSPFLELDKGLVSQVALDYMHLIGLGVTRKLFNLWTCGPLLSRLPAKNVRQISLYLQSISKSL
jgi:hypothetical protein